VIELDDPVHQKQKDYDKVRTEVLEFKNILVVRLTNKEILKDLEKSLGKLKILINRRGNDLGKGKTF
jgi:very-short-patch-repair endonuclease